MNQLDLLAGIQARDEALDRAESHANTEWLDAAKDCLEQCARASLELTADDVVDWLNNLYSDVDTHEPRAMGAVFRWGKAQGMIEPTDRFKPTKRAQGHAGPRRIWKSRL